MNKKHSIQMLLRGLITFAIMGGIAWGLYADDKTTDGHYTLMAGLVATCLAAASVIYEVSAWSFKKQIAIHALAMLVTVYPILLVSGWYKVENIVDALVVLAIFAAVGAVLFTFFALLFFCIINPLAAKRKKSKK